MSFSISRNFWLSPFGVCKADLIKDRFYTKEVTIFSENFRFPVSRKPKCILPPRRLQKNTKLKDGYLLRFRLEKSTNDSKSVAPMAQPMTSKGKCSNFLNRTQLFPKSIFFPVAR